MKNARSLESYCRETTHFANFSFGLLRVLDDFLASGDLSTFMGHLSVYFYSYDDDTSLMDAVKELMKMKVEIAERYGVYDLINIYRGNPTVNLKSAFKKLRVALDKKAVTEKEKASVRLMLEKTQKALEPLVLEYDFKLALEEANLMEYFGFPDASIERHYDGPKPKYIGKKKKAVAAGGDG
ncbi:hypothetical protein LJC60_09485, partial [Ruminococcaceae bacterium OttesenSCG-928-D13]|nr:hypothetical protein [Ruminococcaceae bacterium OttesenSCG-928-D13]